ncbi:MAG: right-handed parallel beta-helix repeat-containing protein [Verrucomicrobium sp.]
MSLRLQCIALVLHALLVTAGHSANWYVAPEPAGQDEADGSLEKPFATISRAQEAASPGDTVLVRGGRYTMTDTMITSRKRIFSRVITLDKSGTPGKPITYRACNDEPPVFDFSQVKPAGQRVSAFYVSGSWLHLQGIEVVGVQVTLKGHTQSICVESQGSHNVFEQLKLHDGQAIGIYHVQGSHNLFLNCDAWNNWDYTSEGGVGGNVDGFGCHPPKGSVGNVFRGCRAWFNSDDGFDCLGAHESVVFEHCWAAHNGYTSTFKSAGDGNGFKAGGYGAALPENLPKTIPRHVVRFCLAVGNKKSGFYANHHPGGGDWINNSAYRNGTNYNMLCRLSDNVTDVDGFGHRLMNNLGFGSRNEVANMAAARCDLAGNSFSTDMKPSSTDFLSLGIDEMFLPRTKTGELPKMGFMQPTTKSALVDAGVDVGFPFKGLKPAIGAFEHASGSQSASN